MLLPVVSNAIIAITRVAFERCGISHPMNECEAEHLHLAYIFLKCKPLK